MGRSYVRCQIDVWKFIIIITSRYEKGKTNRSYFIAVFWPTDLLRPLYAPHVPRNRTILRTPWLNFDVAENLPHRSVTRMISSKEPRILSQKQHGIRWIRQFLSSNSEKGQFLPKHSKIGRFLHSPLNEALDKPYQVDFLLKLSKPCSPYGLLVGNFQRAI